MKWNRFIASQFGKPSGISGIVATFIMNRMNGKLYRYVEDKLCLKLGEKVLDIGFGNGSFIRRLSGIGNGNKIYGIDISEDMLKVAVKKNRNAVLQGRMDLKVGDVISLPYEDSTFDKIYTINTLYFWKDPVKGLKEIGRVLNPDGKCFLVGYEKEWLDKIPCTRYGFRKYDFPAILRMIDKAGLVIVNTEPIEERKSYGMTISRHPYSLFP